MSHESMWPKGVAVPVRSTLDSLRFGFLYKSGCDSRIMSRFACILTFSSTQAFHTGTCCRVSCGSGMRSKLFVSEEILGGARDEYNSYLSVLKCKCEISKHKYNSGVVRT